MAAKYKRLIEDFCAKNGINIPPGFARNTPSRFAIIRTNVTPPKLVATTWSKVADVIYYIENFLSPELKDALSASIRILDFETGEDLAYTGARRLEKIGTFPVGQ